ncbi:extracellular solute-binding protein [Christensenellaceae bacterium NSJ-44]|uniref:Extracellular solute-binding protein n=2 Tax=Luoshenia tenuis TaxID=2763654 RepID=A0A926D1W6_9FIRM|nr:extracellular solute-binding protein [Luoshenia tenuis]MBC8529753.1 extracellular solute-binding protein [Luoshenia tenuis]
MKRGWTMLLSLGLAAAMGLGIAGCGGAPDAGGAGSSGGASGSAGSGAGMATEPVELVFWDMAWGGAETYPPLAEATIKRYTQEVDPNVTFNYTNLPWSNWFETFSTAVASNSAPDFSTGGGFMPFQFAVTGEAADLQWIVDEWKKEGTDTDFPEGALDYWRYKDKQVGIPWNFDPRLSVIRKDWLDEAGLAMPTSWKELIDVAKVFDQRGDDIYGVTFGVVNDSACFNHFGTMNGGLYYNEDGSGNVNKPSTLSTMKFFSDMKKAGVLNDGIEGYQGEDGKKLFIAGKAGILMGGTAQLREPLAAGLDVAVIPPLKTYDGGIMKGQNCINGFMVFEQSKHKDVAMKALKWYSENTGEVFAKGDMNPLPARTSFYEQCTSEYQQIMIKDVLPELAPLCYPLTSARPSTSSIEGQKLAMTLLQSALTQDEAGMKETLGKVQKDLEELIAANDK